MFEPLNASSSPELKDQLREHLLRYGLENDNISWKYFDDAFAPEQGRGLCWTKDDEVRGFLGAIPFPTKSASRDWRATWIVDWSLKDKAKSPGIGVLLLKKIIQAHELVACLGGSDFTLSILPRVAQRSFPDAGVRLRLPLRLGLGMDRLERMFKPLGLLRPLLSPLPLRRMPRGTGLVEPGVSQRLTPLLKRAQRELWRPHYDWNYLNWMVGRCPTLRAATCLSMSEDTPAAGALVWNDTAKPHIWRAAIWNDPAAPGAEQALREVLQTAQRHVYDNQAWELRVMVSERQTALREGLQDFGFAELPKRLPLFFCAEDEESLPGEAFAALSYLDMDLACYF